MNSPEITQILVLGGGVDERGNLGYLSVERAQRAAQHIGEIGAERVIFSGGTSWLEAHDTAPRSEAEMMAELAIDLGVSEAIISCEVQSTNTLTNIAHSSELLTEQAFGIVTHEFHMPRALRIARKLLGGNPEPITPETNYPGLRKHEFIASGISALILMGLGQGDCEEAIRRNDVMQLRMHKSKQRIPGFLSPGMKQKTT